ncbi:MAG: IS5/IS1182 family transposase, partial [Methylocapsa sp.]|nr:IS5/IS1182 family transposase [Methylocapsa sp.]
MENRNGLAVSGTASAANGSAERRASEAMLKKTAQGVTRRARSVLLAAVGLENKETCAEVAVDA